MSSRNTRAAACGAILSLAFAATPVKAGSPFYQLNVLSFSGPVALPGVTLIPGTYEFEVANRDSGDVVRVRNRQTSHVAFMGFTHRVDRPAGERTGPTVVLGEAGPGAAPPVLVWFPIGERTGYEFVYRNKTR